MHEGKYSQSVLQVGWLVLVQAGAEGEEHWKVKNEPRDLCLVLMQMKVKLYKQHHNHTIHQPFISSFSLQLHQEEKTFPLFVKDQEGREESLIGECEACTL